jgi:hypothetical protein
MANIKDRTALVPFILFGIFAVIVGYGIWKGNQPLRDARKIAEENTNL